MISMIVAHDLARNIGYQGEMPWGRDMKADLGRFKELTKDNIVIMGRRTYESIGGFLPDRENIILSSTIPFAFDSVEDILDYVKQRKKDAFVIGGASIYKEFMPYVDRLYITKIHELFEGDTKFPSIIGAWDMVYSPKLLVEGDKYSSQYITLTRRSV